MFHSEYTQRENFILIFNYLLDWKKFRLKYFIFNRIKIIYKVNYIIIPYPRLIIDLKPILIFQSLRNFYYDKLKIFWLLLNE